MNKSFDAVAFQRKARAELGRQYWENREGFLKELAEKNRYSKRSKGSSKVQVPRARALGKS
jgi:hypothetical protein